MGPDSASERGNGPPGPSALELEASLRGHTGIVWCVAWSPRGLLASCGADRSVRVWHRAPSSSGSAAGAAGPPPEQQWQCIADLSGQTFLRTVRSVAWGVDGRSLATACFDATATVLELVGGERPRLEAAVSLEGHESEVKSIAYSSSGGLLASASRDRSVWVWEVGLEFDYECVAVLNGHTGDVKCVRWHPSAEILLSASYDNDIRVWVEDEDDWFCLETLSAHDSTVWAMAFDASGKHFASVGDGGTVVIWCRREPHASMVGDHARFGVVAHLSHVHAGVVMSVDWAPDANVIVTAGDDDSIRVLRRKDGSAANFTVKPGADAVAASAEEPTGDEGGDTVGGRASASEPEVQGEDLLRTESDQIWEEDIAVERAHSGCVNAVAWHPVDETVLASCGDDGLVRIWKYSTPSA